MERRDGETSTAFCTQCSPKDWRQRLGSGVHAGAIMDRSLSNSIGAKTGTYDVRECTALTRPNPRCVAPAVRSHTAAGALPRDRWC